VGRVAGIAAVVGGVIAAGTRDAIVTGVAAADGIVSGTAPEADGGMMVPAARGAIVVDAVPVGSAASA